jgi:hypothetical protein
MGSIPPDEALQQSMALLPEPFQMSGEKGKRNMEDVLENKPTLQEILEKINQKRPCQEITRAKLARVTLLSEDEVLRVVTNRVIVQQKVAKVLRAVNFLAGTQYQLEEIAHGGESREV